jgi:hypothetical protein
MIDVVDPQVAILAAQTARDASFYAFWGLVVTSVTSVLLAVAVPLVTMLLKRMTLLEKNTNSIKDALIEETRASNLAKGVLQGRAQVLEGTK